MWLLRLKDRPAALTCNFKEIYEVIWRDKKASDGVPRFALLEDIGVPFYAEGAYCTEVPREILRKVLGQTLSLIETIS